MTAEDSGGRVGGAHVMAGLMARLVGSLLILGKQASCMLFIIQAISKVVNEENLSCCVGSFVDLKTLHTITIK